MKESKHADPSKQTKKVGFLLLAAVGVLLCLLFLSSCAGETGKLAYDVNLDGETCTVTGIGTWKSPHLVIPSTIDGYRVTEIGAGAFEGAEAVTAVTVPAGVIKIGSGVFQGSGLTSIEVDPENPVYHSAGNCLIETERKALIFGCENSVIPADGSVVLLEEKAFVGTADLHFDGTKEAWAMIRKASGWNGGTQSYVAHCIDGSYLGFPYEVNSDGETCTVTGKGIWQGSDLVIPSVIDGYRVTGIGERAFRDCKTLVSVSFPDTLTKIKEGAFEFCLALASVTLPDSVTEVEPWAFQGCRHLKSVAVGDGLTKVEEYVFSECWELSSVSLGDAVGVIDYEAFAGCESLAELVIPPGVTELHLSAFNGTKLSALTIPAGVSIVKTNAFDGLTELASIEVDPENPVYHSAGNCLIETESKTLVLGCENSVIPADGSVTCIGNLAFSRSAIAEIVLPAGIIQIKSSAFAYCKKLESVTIPEGVTEIQDSAFGYCTGLLSVTLPDSVTSIGYGAFAYCQKLESIVIPDSVRYMGDCSFEACLRLREVTLPDGIKSIGMRTFASCRALTAIEIPETVEKIGWQAFQNSGLVEIFLPDGVVTIDYGAFSECYDLVSVRLPSSVEKIDRFAFSSIKALVIEFDGTQEQWEAVQKASSWAEYSTVVHCTDDET